MRRSKNSFRVRVQTGCVAAFKSGIVVLVGPAASPTATPLGVMGHLVFVDDRSSSGPRDQNSYGLAA